MIIMKVKAHTSRNHFRTLFVSLVAALTFIFLSRGLSMAYLSMEESSPYSPSDRMRLSVQGTALDVPNTQQLVHDIGNIWLLVSNYGFFGNLTHTEFDSTACHNGFISCQFPARSNWDYLFQGALWIGSIAGSDTLVSCGHDGWAHEQEMYPGFDEADSIIVRTTRQEITVCGNAIPYSEEAISEQDFIAIYTDTLLSSDYSGVSANHTRPLGIEIIQQSYNWSYSYAEDFIIFDYWIKNIGLKVLNDVYIALYLDGDCGPKPYDYPSSHRRAQDDITGFREYTEDSILVNIAWLADYEGEPGGDADDDALAPGVMGVRVVRAPKVEGTASTGKLEILYNWWLSDTNAEKDWGPGTCFPDGLCGTPDGDINKYLLLSDWKGDGSDANQLDTSRGGKSIGAEDTRFLLSFGPFRISPGDSLPFTLGYMCGEDFYRQGSKYDIDYTDLEINAKWVQFVYDNPMRDTDGDGFYGEDVGLDGLYVGDEGYTGPDADGTESNGKLDRALDDTYPEDEYQGIDSEGQPRFSQDRYGFGNGILDEGDGIPDFSGPPPPPSPLLRGVVDENGNIALQWTRDPEDFEDPFITKGDKKDFAGYRIYKSNSGVISDYILLSEMTLGSEALEAALIEDGPVKAVSASGDTIEYYYEYVVEGVLENWPIYVSVTSFDTGYEPLKLESLESSVNYNALLMIPSKSLNVTKDKDPYVVPNPYRIDGIYEGIWWEDWENQGQNWTEFKRRLDFVNLPGNCTIRVFTLSGDLVDTIHNSDGDSRETWDLLSKDIQAITSGIYLFSVEPKSGGDTYIGKFVIIK
jgi:hypothetical protein